MKYQSGKIKKEHHILSDFKKVLESIEKIPQVKRIIPGRIYRKQKGSSHKKISFSYKTESGMKFIMKKGGTAQEVFVLCGTQDKEFILNKINAIEI
ncbi:DUF2103 domain-containing protein [Candidatus Vampirococcus lugosii]|uniref:Metal-binding protein n=1 Tax=Candidatus Vampirococcus lugosii TaxID=2789015 RepID=A0ABS5QL84_9BACT|nr:DUF2103 domain-containing protein [Candidatus Vampirococcus lugosii]MBS8121908.1 putative metal-binding protein [Candidatus Vampirococcus lugosii]